MKIYLHLLVSHRLLHLKLSGTIDNKTLYNFKMSRKDINYVGQLFKCDGKPKLWEELKNEFNLQGQLQFIYNQIIHSIPKSWKDALIANLENIKNLVFQGHHLIKKS